MKESREFVDKLDRCDWAKGEFERASIVGDRRVNARAILMTSDFAERLKRAIVLKALVT